MGAGAARPTVISVSGAPHGVGRYLNAKFRGVDYDEVERHARLLLETTEQFGGGAFDPASIGTMARGRTDSWLADPAQVRLTFQALDLLKHLGLSRRAFGPERTVSRDRRRTGGGTPLLEP